MKKIIAVIVLIAGMFFILSGFFLKKENDSLPGKMEISYPYVGKYHNGFVSVSDGNKVYYLNRNGKKIFEYKEKVTNSEVLEKYYFKDGYGIFSKNNCYGIINKNGKEVIKPIYRKVEIIDKNTFLVTEDNGDTLFVNEKNQKISKLKYYDIYKLTDILFKASSNGKTGVINKKGEKIIPFIYDFVQNINDTIFVAIGPSEIESGIIYAWQNNKMVQLKVPKFVSYLYDDTYLYLKNTQNRNFLYNYKTKELLELNNSYEMLGKFSNNLAYASTDGENIGFINIEEEFIIPPMYSALITIGFNKYGYAVVSKKENGRLVCGVIDDKNEVVLPFVYDNILILSNNVAAVLKDNFYELKKFGNKLGSTKRYRTIEPTVRKDLYIISVGDFDNLRYGLIDTTGKEVYEPKYKFITVYNDQVKIMENDHYIIDFEV